MSLIFHNRKISQRKRKRQDNDDDDRYNTDIDIDIEKGEDRRIIIHVHETQLKHNISRTILAFVVRSLQYLEDHLYTDIDIDRIIIDPLYNLKVSINQKIMSTKILVHHKLGEAKEDIKREMRKLWGIF